MGAMGSCTNPAITVKAECVAGARQLTEHLLHTPQPTFYTQQLPHTDSSMPFDGAPLPWLPPAGVAGVAGVTGVVGMAGVAGASGLVELVGASGGDATVALLLANVTDGIISDGGGVVASPHPLHPSPPMVASHMARRILKGGGGDGLVWDGTQTVEWANPRVGSFDDFGSAMLLLYVMSTGDECVACPSYCPWCHVACLPHHTSLDDTWHALLTILPLMTRGMPSSPYFPW